MCDTVFDVMKKVLWLSLLTGASGCVEPPAAGPAFSPVSMPPPTPVVEASLPANEQIPKAELRDLREIKSRRDAQQRFVAEILLTGSAPVGQPVAEVTLYDARGTAVGSGTCSSNIRWLPGNEKVPCAFMLLKRAEWSTYKVEFHFSPPLPQDDSAEFDITDIRFIPAHDGQPDTLEGKLTNKSSFKATGVWAIATLYDATKKIVATDSKLISGADLDAGQSSPFSTTFDETAGPPVNYRVVAIGYREQPAAERLTLGEDVHFSPAVDDLARHRLPMPCRLDEARSEGIRGNPHPFCQGGNVTGGDIGSPGRCETYFKAQGDVLDCKYLDRRTPQLYAVDLLAREKGASMTKLGLARTPPNTALLLTACLRRGRRCRPLAARTAAAECHVGWAERPDLQTASDSDSAECLTRGSSRTRVD